MKEEKIQVEKSDFEIDYIYSHLEPCWTIVGPSPEDGLEICVFGGDTACEDHYDRCYIETVFSEWDGTLYPYKDGYQIDTSTFPSFG